MTYAMAGLGALRQITRGRTPATSKATTRAAQTDRYTVQPAQWTLWAPQLGIGTSFVSATYPTNKVRTYRDGFAQRGARVVVLTRRPYGVSSDEPVAAWEWNGWNWVSLWPSDYALDGVGALQLHRVGAQKQPMKRTAAAPVATARPRSRVTAKSAPGRTVARLGYYVTVQTPGSSLLTLARYAQAPSAYQDVLQRARQDWPAGTELRVQHRLDTGLGDVRETLCASTKTSTGDWVPSDPASYPGCVHGQRQQPPASRRAGVAVRWPMATSQLEKPFITVSIWTSGPAPTHAGSAEAWWAPTYRSWDYSSFAEADAATATLVDIAERLLMSGQATWVRIQQWLRTPGGSDDEVLCRAKRSGDGAWWTDGPPLCPLT